MSLMSGYNTRYSRAKKNCKILLSAFHTVGQSLYRPAQDERDVSRHLAQCQAPKHVKVHTARLRLACAAALRGVRGHGRRHEATAEGGWWRRRCCICCCCRRRRRHSAQRPSRLRAARRCSSRARSRDGRVPRLQAGQGCRSCEAAKALCRCTSRRVECASRRRRSRLPHTQALSPRVPPVRPPGPLDHTTP